jgi:hypothetical protein
MTGGPSSRPSRLVIAHAFIFASAVVCLTFGAFLEKPELLLVAGPCFLISGLLIWVGNRVTLSGPIGAVLRMALGPSQLLTLRVRALIWILAGVAVTAWGIEEVRQARDREPLLLEEPMATLARPFKP